MAWVFRRPPPIPPRRVVAPHLGTFTRTATQALEPALYSDDDTFFSATVIAGAVNLSPSLYSDADTFYAQTLAATYALTPSLYSDDDTFNAHAVTAGAVNLSPSLYSDADAFHAHTLSSTYALTPALYSDADTFNTHLIYGVVKIAPDADVTDGGWTNELGSNADLYASIDEADIDDGDYIQSEAEPVNDVCRIGLSAASMAEPMTVAVRFKKEGPGQIDLTVRLMEGMTEIAEWVYTDIGSDYLTVREELTAPQFAAISNFNDLFVELEANKP